LIAGGQGRTDVLHLGFHRAAGDFARQSPDDTTAYSQPSDWAGQQADDPADNTAGDEALGATMFGVGDLELAICVFDDDGGILDRDPLIFLRLLELVQRFARAIRRVESGHDQLNGYVTHDFCLLLLLLLDAVQARSNPRLPGCIS
jgi:hypothetical protein